MTPLFQFLRRSKRPTRSQRGFGMVELILGLALFGLLLLQALKTTDRAADQTAGRTEADEKMAFQKMVAYYFEQNRSAYVQAMTDGTDAASLCMVNMNADGTGGTQANDTALHTCAFDLTLLRTKKQLPDGMGVLASGGRYVAIHRLVYDGATPTGGVEAVVFLAPSDPVGGTLSAAAQDERRLNEMLASKDALGGTGGIVPVGDQGNCKNERSTSTYQACGNGWKVDLSNFISSAQLTTFANALPN